MRTKVLGAVLVGTAVVLGGLVRAGAGQGSIGTYLAPFREDGATYHAATDTFTGGHYDNQATDASGCVADASNISPHGNPQAYRCLPAGATMAALPNGKILYWNALEGTENLTGTNYTVPDGGRLTVNDEARLLTLAPGGPKWSLTTPVDGGAHNTSTAEDLPLPPPFAATHFPYNNGSLFCSDQVFLSDGSVLTTGGTDYYEEPTIPLTDKGVVELEGIRNTRVYVPKDNHWVQVGSMNHGRWYPSLVTLASGEVFVASGVTKLIKPLYFGHLADSGTNVKQTETFNPKTGQWTDNGTGAERSLPLFPRLHLLPDGHVYYDAAGQDFNPAGQSYDEALWNIAGSYDPATKTWTDLGIPALGSPFGGFRGSTFSAALPLRPATNGSYPQASFLTAGGVLLPSPGSYVATNNSRIDTVTVGSGGEHLSSTATGSLGRGRWFSTAVPLPDGTVYAASGADVDEVITPGLESPIRAAELFTPTVDPKTGTYTGGTWHDAGTQARKRTYHNDAILLPDGSVLIGGNAPIPFLYTQVRDGVNLPGRPGTNNHHDASFQIWRPPYYSKQRPTVTGVQATPGGRDLVIRTPDWRTIVSVVLMRNTAQTHLIDGDARSVMLPIIGRNAGDGTVTVALPDSSNVLPNGPYLLFANQNKNKVNDAAPGHVVPSIGKQLMIGGTSVPQLEAVIAN